MRMKNIKDFLKYHVKIPVQNLIIDHGTQKMKRFWLKRYAYYCGDGVTVGPGVKFFNLNRIFICGGVSIGDGTKIYSSPGRLVKIGDNSLIAPDVTIINSNHNYKDKSRLIRDQGETSGDVIIGNDCWIATKTIILPNVIIGDGCVVAAGSVVTKSVEPDMVVAGVPAKCIGNRLYTIQ